MGSDCSLCWTQAIHRGAGRHHISLIIVFILLDTVGFLHRKGLNGRKLIGSFGWGGDTMELVLKLHLHKKHAFLLHWKFVGAALEWLIGRQRQSPLCPLATSSSHAQIPTMNLKIRAKTCSNLHHVIIEISTSTYRL